MDYEKNEIQGYVNSVSVVVADGEGRWLRKNSNGGRDLGRVLRDELSERDREASTDLGF